MLYLYERVFKTVYVYVCMCINPFLEYSVSAHYKGQNTGLGVKILDHAHNPIPSLAMCML